MRDIFTQEDCQVGHTLDLVQWILGPNKIRIYYPTCFKLAALIRVAGKAAVELAGGNVELWRELARYELEAPVVPLHNEYRRAGFDSNLTSYSADLEGSLVVVKLNELTAKFHCTDALILQAWLDVAARQAKRWAGDDSTALIVTARLTDARKGKGSAA